MAYLWLKAFHIVGVVAWFAGLFYLVRLFIYHVEAEERPEAERSVLQPQFALMERRLFRIITRPAMMITLLTAAGMLALQPGCLRDWSPLPSALRRRGLRPAWRAEQRAPGASW
ncbi:MAG TPA: CopD family protein [Gemmatimonadales bacterium]|nr:CopD family protein [Gemmatimonadales bacterium]